MTWVFLLINTLLILGAVASDQITVGGGTGNVHKNAPYTIENFYGVMSLLGLLMTTAYMHATANRDFANTMHPLIFSSPIKKHQYFFGKFFGAVSIAVLPMLGVSLGSLLGPLISDLPPERFGPVIWSGHLHGLLVFGIPNTFIVSVILYGLAMHFRSSIASFGGAIFLLVFYVVSSGYTADLEKEWLACLLDPFGFYPESIASKYLSVQEKNLQTVPITYWLLMNRMVWLALSGLLLLFFYRKFSFSAAKEKQSKQKMSADERYAPTQLQAPASASPAQGASFRGWLSMVAFECSCIIKNPTFVVLMLLGTVNLTASLTSFTDSYGLSKYPVTYDVIEVIHGSFYLFMIGFITFYTGVLVWRERDDRINEILDATPVRNFSILSSKLVSMWMGVGLMIAYSILVGIMAQALHGYFRFELSVYFTSLLVFDLLKFGYLIVASMLFHYLINNRYIAYFAFVAFVVLNAFLWSALKTNSNMLIFGGIPTITYSDMNGFGPFLLSAGWFHVYWMLFSCILFMIALAFFVRGKEVQWKSRVRTAGLFFKRNTYPLLLCLAAFVCCAAFVYYNTHALNKFVDEGESEKLQVDYERTYKKYENLVQPRFYRYAYTIDVFPESRSVKARIKAGMRNLSSEAIREIHFSLPPIPDSIRIDIKGAKLKLNDERLRYRIYTLREPMNPNDSMEVVFSVSKAHRGFENEVSFLLLTQNGTFFNNTDIVPLIGYVEDYEMQEKNKRVEYKLPPRKRIPKLDEHNLKARSNTYISSCSDWVKVQTTISTSGDQLAVAPGSLQKQWRQGGRNYFTYTLDHPSLDFYSFISAAYEVERKHWKGVDLEVYYIKEHPYNVPNMMRSLEKSLDYYTRNFGPYRHKQCRILEFPRYSAFAQAFPGTMPYSESIGFIADLREVSTEDIDLVFYVVAHEMGHQYWAHQLCGANMQGSEWMSEGFAQYSALMVMEAEYGRDKMHKFLKYEMDGYLSRRGREAEGEQPIYKTERQAYIHYQKASVAMYYLKEMIGEQKVNQALRSLLDAFAYRKPPYATSLHALRALKQVTPDSLAYLVQDGFETITLFSNRVLTATSRKVADGYEVKVTFAAEKFRADSMGKETPQPVNDYIDVACFSRPEGQAEYGKKLFYQRRKISGKHNQLTFKTKEAPYLFGVDPYHFLIDRNPDDNTQRISEE
jgi:hypothetical protein